MKRTDSRKQGAEIQPSQMELNARAGMPDAFDPVIEQANRYDADRHRARPVRENTQ
jgi:hypothetical protein